MNLNFLLPSLLPCWLCLRQQMPSSYQEGGESLVKILCILRCFLAWAPPITRFHLLLWKKVPISIFSLDLNNLAFLRAFVLAVALAWQIPLTCGELTSSLASGPDSSHTFFLVLKPKIIILKLTCFDFPLSTYKMWFWFSLLPNPSH